MSGFGLQDGKIVAIGNSRTSKEAERCCAIDACHKLNVSMWICHLAQQGALLVDTWLAEERTAVRF